MSEEPEWSPVHAGLVGRCAWEVEATQRDLEVLAWVARFRFVTAQAVAARFDVHEAAIVELVTRLELADPGCGR